AGTGHRARRFTATRTPYSPRHDDTGRLPAGRPLAVMTAIRVLVADDHPTFVRAVTLLLNGDPDIEVVATAANGAEAIEHAMRKQPDGIDATRQIIDAAPHVAVVALTMFDDDDN